MTQRKRRPTLASILDSTPWDYAPGKDGRLLLAPLERLFASVSWEFKPQHLGIAPERPRPVIRRDRQSPVGIDAETSVSSRSPGDAE
jgi:hypothetical protein